MGNNNQRPTLANESSDITNSSPARKRLKLSGSISFRSIASLASNHFSNNLSDDHQKERHGRKRKHIKVSESSPSISSGSIISIERHWPAYTNSVFEPEFPITGRICESDYVILNCIGKGRFANVYRAISRSNNSHVAMKIQDKTRILKSGAEDQIKNEVNVQRLLGKSNFVAEFFDSWQTSQELFTIMEYIDGAGDLFSLFSEYGNFSEQMTCLYAVEIALGLHFLHTNGIVHRDLKLENLSLDASLHIKFVDFGFSKHLEPNGRTNTICGTLQFMAPEIVSEKPYGFKVDWWSYGISLFVMRTGKYPFPNNLAITHNDLTFKRQEFPEICSDEFKEVVDKLLVLDPDKRLSSMSELFSQRFFENVNIEGIQSKEVSPFEILKSECNPIERLKINHGFDEHYNNFDFSLE